MKAQPCNSMNELPLETREFLANLRKEDLDTLEEGVKLVNALKTVGRFSRWVILGILSIFLGGVLIWENVLKVIAWMKSPG